MASSSASSCTLVTIIIQPSIERTAVALVCVCMSAMRALAPLGAWGEPGSSSSIWSSAIGKGVLRVVIWTELSTVRLGLCNAKLSDEKGAVRVECPRSRQGTVHDLDGCCPGSSPHTHRPQSTSSLARAPPAYSGRKRFSAKILGWRLLRGSSREFGGSPGKQSDSLNISRIYQPIRCLARQCKSSSSPLGFGLILTSTVQQRLAHSGAHPQWHPGEEAKLLRRCRRQVQGCHRPSSLYHVQHGRKAKQVGALGVQEQAAGLYKVCILPQ